MVSRNKLDGLRERLEESDVSSREPIGESEENIEDLMADLSSFLEAYTTYETASHDEMVSECIARMGILNLSTSCITSFTESGTVMKSIPKQTESGKLDAEVVPILDEETAFIKKFEERNKCIVYHVTRRTRDYGNCMEIWSVGQNKAEWGLQKSDLLQNKSYVWAENFTKPIFSEAGYITFTVSSGALLRIE